MENLQENENKECVICQFKDHQEELVETPEGWAHRTCLDEQDIEREEVSEENNEQLEL